MSIEQYKKELKELVGKPKTEKMLLFVAILTEILKSEKIEPIIVGGFSVELYTLNSYLTEDIDLVMDGREKANKILLELGFVKKGKNWYNKELNLSIEIPDNWLDGDTDKVLKMNIGNNRYVKVIGVEDIISDRLRACEFWKANSDCEWAYRMFYTHRENIDLPYLLNRTKKDGTVHLLEKWLNEE